MKISNFISKPVTQPVNGEIFIPGDKSISHRAIMLGAIANGETTIKNFSDGADCLSTLNAFKAMGVGIKQIEPQQIIIQGVGPHGLKKPLQTIDCGNSGTTMRLLSGILATQSFDSELTGDQSLLKRPMGRVSAPLRQMGADIKTTDGQAPIIIRGSQKLHGISYKMPNASAQVKSSLLFAGLYAEGETRILELEKTRDHTERMLKAFSYPINTLDNEIVINSKSELHGVNLQVPGDLSSAAFFIVAATIIPESKLIIRQVGINPTRLGIIKLLKQMGAKIEVLAEFTYGEEPVADLYVESATLHGIEIPETLVSLTIDEFPVLFIAAACAKGQTVVRGAKELRFKESDRLSVMAEGLNNLGIKSEILADGICINGGIIQGGRVDSYQDHRVAMAFAIAGAVAQKDVDVIDSTNVSTSFPTFVQKARQINLDIREFV